MRKREYNRLKEVRLRQGLKLPELAKISGVTYTRCWSLEQGYGNPTITTARLLARALGVTIDEIWPVNTAEEESNESC